MNPEGTGHLEDVDAGGKTRLYIKIDVNAGILGCEGSLVTSVTSQTTENFLKR